MRKYLTIVYFEVDQPACNLWSIFIKLFPEAKVTLTILTISCSFSNDAKNELKHLSNFHETFRPTKQNRQVILMERDSEEVWASSYAGMFAYYREKVSTRFSKSA